MTSVVEAKRAYFKQATGSDATSVADLETAYYEAAAAGTAVVVPEATTGQEGTVKQAPLVADAAGATPTKAEFDALLTALKAGGIMALS